MLLTPLELLALFAHFTLLSLLAVGGAISTAPEMHRYLVTETHWLTDAQFSGAIALAQAAPGPNVLFVAVLGWTVAGPLGACATMTGMLLPSTFVSLWATRWTARRRHTLAVRAFKTGMAPLTIGLLFATAWLLIQPTHASFGALGIAAITAFVMTRTHWSPVWPVAIGGLAGALGWA